MNRHERRKQAALEKRGDFESHDGNVFQSGEDCYENAISTLSDITSYYLHDENLALFDSTAVSDTVKSFRDKLLSKISSHPHENIEGCNDLYHRSLLLMLDYREYVYDNDIFDNDELWPTDKVTGEDHPAHGSTRDYVNLNDQINSLFLICTLMISRATRGLRPSLEEALHFLPFAIEGQEDFRDEAVDSIADLAIAMCETKNTERYTKVINRDFKPVSWSWLHQLSCLLTFGASIGKWPLSNNIMKLQAMVTNPPSGEKATSDGKAVQMINRLTSDAEAKISFGGISSMEIHAAMLAMEINGIIGDTTEFETVKSWFDACAFNMANNILKMPKLSNNYFVRNYKIRHAVAADILSGGNIHNVVMSYGVGCLFQKLKKDLEAGLQPHWGLRKLIPDYKNRTHFSIKKARIADLQ